jgi:ATPase family associated with various cellular activities (AAA)
VELLEQLRVYRTLSIGVPFIDRSTVFDLFEAAAVDLGVTARRLTVVDLEIVSVNSLVKLLEKLAQETGTLVLVEGIPSLLSSLAGLERSLLVQYIVDLYYQLQAKPNCYFVFLDCNLTTFPEDLANLIPTYELPLPTRASTAPLFDGVGWDVKLAEIVVGLSRSEIELGLKIGVGKNLTVAERREFLLDYKIGRLRLLGLDVTPRPKVAQFGGMDLLRVALESVQFRFTPKAQERGLAIPKGWLLIGPPGTGKTHTANCLAVEMGWAKFAIGVDRVAAGSVVQFKRLLQIIEACAPCLVYFDELDKFFAGSTADPQILGCLLTWLQDKTSDTFVIATLNRVENVPVELTRKGRFDDIYNVGLPNYAGRREILRLYLSKLDPRHANDGDPFSRNDWQRILSNTDNFSGSELAFLVDRAWELTLLEDINSTAIELSTLLASAKTIKCLFDRDTDRMLEIQERCRYYGLPVASDFDDYAPTNRDLQGIEI